MKQATLGLSLDIKKTRKQVFLNQMDQVVPWGCLGRTHCPLLPRKQDWQAPLFVDDHAAHALHAAVTHFA